MAAEESKSTFIPSEEGEKVDNTPSDSTEEGPVESIHLPEECSETRDTVKEVSYDGSTMTSEQPQAQNAESADKTTETEQSQPAPNDCPNLSSNIKDNDTYQIDDVSSKSKTPSISLECTEEISMSNNDSMDSFTLADKDDDEVFISEKTESSEKTNTATSDSACMAALDDTTVNETDKTSDDTPTPKPRKRRRRGSAWSDEQTEYLMEIWARHAAEQRDKEEEDNNPHTNPPVYRVIAKAMQEQGNTKTWVQCKTRIHTLKRAYKLTKDEITTGAPNITYCRHFDKLEIIMCDNETTPPENLADLLEARRKHREANASYVPTVKTPVRRRLITLPNKFAKQNNSPVVTVDQQQQQNFQPMANQQFTHTTSTNELWVNQPQNKTQYEQSQLSSHSQQHDVNKPAQDYTGPSMFQQSQTPANLPQYLQTKTSETLVPARMPEINNNDVGVKTESQDNTQQCYNMSTMSSQTWAVPKPPPQKEELEKMRLNLELRKIEMERNKLEMAERERREERDHQYRMLQLLMFGLGQQNSAHTHPGQGAEQVVAQAQNSTNLIRALENGLVPGGPYTANEKGLSFNEI